MWCMLDDEQVHSAPGLDDSAEMRLRELLYAQCLGYEVPRVRRAPASSTAGWVGAAQVGPFAPEDAGDSSDEDCRGQQDGPQLRQHVTRAPAFVDLMGAAEQVEQCVRCGTSPCWSDQGET